MAVHSDLAGLSIEALEEYLLTAKLCLKYRKPDGGCLGYSAVLLLFCVVDALGGYLRDDKTRKTPKHEPFRVLRHPCFGLTDLSDVQVKRLESWYRNGLAHNAVIPPGTCLSEENGDPFEFASNGDPVKIRVSSFYQLVAEAWKRFDKALIVPSKKLDKRNLPTTGAEPAKSVACSVASTACPMEPKVRDL